MKKLCQSKTSSQVKPPPKKNFNVPANFAATRLPPRRLRSVWQELRGNKWGVHFRRQQVIAGFIIDFYCHRAGLVVEVDGDIHDLQQEEDARREKILREMGLRIVRFRNEDMEKDFSAVLEKVRGLVESHTIRQ